MSLVHRSVDFRRLFPLQILKKLIFAMLPKKRFKMDWGEVTNGSDVKMQMSDVKKPGFFNFV